MVSELVWGTLKGFVYTSWCLPICWENATEDTARMRGLGVEVVEIMFAWYVLNTSTSTKVYPCNNSPKDADLIRVIDAVHAAGMEVALKPSLDVEDGTWCAFVGTNYTTEQQWDDWFGNYTAFVVHFAQLGRSKGIVGFNVGTELEGTHLQEARWRKLINATRVVLGTSVKMWLGANWEWEGVPGYKRINFWDALDYYGVDMYAPLSLLPDPSLNEAIRGWEHTLSNITMWWHAQGTPLKGFVFAEIGYASFRQASVHPNECCSGAPDLATQTILYQSYFDAVHNQIWMAGVFWWAWSDLIDLNPFNDTSFDIWGKPATEVVKKGYSG
jgi:hypothetical protein